MMLRAVADTNIFISGLLWNGIPGRVLNIFIDEQAILLLSEDILHELEIKLNHPKFATRIYERKVSVESLMDDFRDLAEMVLPAYIPADAVHDPKDRIILACAIGGEADYIISGDKDLTSLKNYAGIHIVTPMEFIEIVESQ